jgi:hypothetical protein
VRAVPGLPDDALEQEVLVMLQLVGALLVLAGFVAAQAGRLDPAAPLYLAVNLIGSAILAVDAFHAGAWGFLLLEGVWALVSAWGLAQAWRARTTSGLSAPATGQGVG